MPRTWWLAWGLKPTLESLLNPDRSGTARRDRKLWGVYERARGAYLEREAVGLLGSRLKSNCLAV